MKIVAKSAFLTAWPHFLTVCIIPYLYSHPTNTDLTGNDIFLFMPQGLGTVREGGRHSLISCKWKQLQPQLLQQPLQLWRQKKTNATRGKNKKVTKVERNWKGTKKKSFTHFQEEGFQIVCPVIPIHLKETFSSPRAWSGLQYKVDEGFRQKPKPCPHGFPIITFHLFLGEIFANNFARTNVEDDK